MISLLLIALGATLLVWGADRAVSSAGVLAGRLGIAPVVVGLTVTSVGTSLPEIATNLAAAVRTAGGADASGIAVGNIVGSNLSQITLLLGITTLVGGLVVPRAAVRREGAAAVVALLLMLGTCLDGTTTRLEGAALAGTYLLWLVWLARTAPREAPVPRSEGGSSRPTLVGWLLVGLVAVIGGAHLLVTEGQALARAAGLDDEVIGLMVGVGTGLPELALSVQAARKGNSGLAVGNLLGSNITDPLLSYGLGAMVAPVAVAPAVLRIDFPVWGLSTALALWLLWGDERLDRKEGALLVVLFVAYAGARLAMG